MRTASAVGLIACLLAAAAAAAADVVKPWPVGAEEDPPSRSVIVTVPGACGEVPVSVVLDDDLTMDAPGQEAGWVARVARTAACPNGQFLGDLTKIVGTPRYNDGEAASPDPTIHLTPHWVVTPGTGSILADAAPILLKGFRWP